jgi:hypothetical protein
MSLMRITQLLALMLSMFCLSPVMENPIQAWAQQEIRISVVDYPRPIVPAVRQIEKHFGRVVTYEDTRYVNSTEIVDVTVQFSRNADKTKRILQMRSGSIVLAYTPRSGTIDDQVEEVLQEVLTRSNAAGNTGDFRVQRVSGGYHIVPVAMVGKSGAMEPYASPLESRITLTSQPEDGLEMMVRLTRAVSEQSGITVSSGVMPMNLMSRARLSVSAKNERARDVLWRALQSISPNLSYELLCGAGERGTCGLSIHPVQIKH